MNNTAEKLPFSQRLGHVTGGVGHNLIYAMMAGYVSIFFTDVFGLNAGYVATLFLAARIWDAVNDPIMGLICDRTRSRFGHFRCWLLYASPVVGLALILCFRVPANAQTAGYAYAAIFYVLLGMSFTAVDIPYWGLPAAMTDDPAERTRVYTAAGMASTLASGAGAIAIPAMVTAFGADDQAGAIWPRPRSWPLWASPAISLASCW
jgi:Na+/melibiose symporter-like transporter